MVQDPLNNPPSPNRGWGWNRDPWGAGCGWFILFWIIIIIIFAGWGWWGGRGWNNGGWGGGNAGGGNNNRAQMSQAPTPLNVTNNYYFGPGSDEFLGKKITIKGKIDRVYNPQVFTLAAESGGGHDVLVVTSQKGAALKKGESVEVIGSVQKFEAGAFAKESKAEVDKRQLAEFRERPAIFATSVKPEEHPTSTTPNQPNETK